MKSVPSFKNEKEEQAFWLSHDSTDYLDWDKAEEAIFPNLKPSTKAISLRLTETMIAEIKVEANKQDVPYQSLIKIWLNEKLHHA